MRIPALLLVLSLSVASRASTISIDGDDGPVWGSPITEFLTPFLSYDPYGDSITFGQAASSYASTYPSVVGKHFGVIPNNHGVGGTTVKTTLSAVMAFNAQNNATQLASIMLGTNDKNVGGVDAVQAADYGAGLLAEAAYLAIPAANKVGASSCTLGGTWTAGTFPPYTKTTSTQNNTATCIVTGSTVIVTTIMQATSGAGGTGSLTCDGTATGATLNFSGNSGATILEGSLPSMTVVTGLTNTTHSCVVAVTSSSGAVELLWAAGLPGTTQTNYPTVLVGNIPSENPANSLSDLYRPYTSAAVTALNALGLAKVLYVDTFPTLSLPIQYTDSAHPNDYGYSLLAQAYISAVETNLGYSINNSPPYYGAPLYNYSNGNVNLFAGNTFSSRIGAVTTGTQNTIFGNSSTGYSGLTTASRNAFFGHFACPDTTTGSDNTCFGYRSGNTPTSITTGSTNTFFGSSAGASSATAVNRSSFGYQASSTADNTAQIGNASVLSLGIGAVSWSHGAGVPSGACTTGNLYTNTSGGTSTTFYVCEATAWIAK